MTVKESFNRDYGLLVSFLKGILFRLQFVSALEFLLLLSSSFVLILLGGLAATKLRETFPYLPFVYSWVAILFLFSLILPGLWRITFRPSLERVARGLEEKFPHLSDDVTNSLLLFDQIKKEAGSEHISEGLIIAQIRRTAGQVCAIKPWQVVSFKKVFRHLRLIIPLMLTLFVVLIIDPHFLNRSLALIIHPLSALPIRESFISIEPRGSIVLRGSPVVINAQVTGNLKDRLKLAVWPEGREAVHLNMESEGDGRFIYQMASAQFSFQYQAYNSRSTSPVYKVRVVDPPEVGKVKLTLIPPDYTHLPREVRQEGHIEALKGTVVNLEAQTNKVIKEGKITLSQGNQLALNVKGDYLTGSLVVFYPGTYSIHVKDAVSYTHLTLPTKRIV